ncbi:phosphonate C-P lyase system protein PhnG [Streptomyces sp. PRh5]|uniref:phosphonate C-P lyase system protein PhnG n=1 Tax=Streptomyces sp. PRh5 TaxID=1158056 RepID=UPI0018E29C23|nr:phosphonate C-P lyase system protein PhnG [Streptomyces sp. PRh5]
MNREHRCALLAEADRAELIELADACIADGARVRMLVGPEVGCVTAQVREPVLEQRFLLGDVLACRAEVEFAGHRCWAMRLGDDRAAALAAAVLDAEAQSGRPPDRRDRRAVRTDRGAPGAAGGPGVGGARPTVVEFEELT